MRSSIRGARRLGQRQRGGEEIGNWLGPTGEAKQPVGADSQGPGTIGGKLGIGQARAGLQQGGNGGPIHPRLPGQTRLTDPARGHRLGQPGAKDGGTVAFVDFIHNSSILQNTSCTSPTLSRIPLRCTSCYAAVKDCRDGDQREDRRPGD